MDFTLEIVDGKLVAWSTYHASTEPLQIVHGWVVGPARDAFRGIEADWRFGQLAARNRLGYMLRVDMPSKDAEYVYHVTIPAPKARKGRTYEWRGRSGDGEGEWQYFSKTDRCYVRA